MIHYQKHDNKQNAVLHHHAEVTLQEQLQLCYITWKVFNAKITVTSKFITYIEIQTTIQTKQ